MKGGGGGVAPAKRRWRGLAIGVLFLVVLSMLVPLGFLLGLHNGFHSAGASILHLDRFLIRASASATHYIRSESESQIQISLNLLFMFLLLLVLLCISTLTHPCLLAIRTRSLILLNHPYSFIENRTKRKNHSCTFTPSYFICALPVPLQDLCLFNTLHHR